MMSSLLRNDLLTELNNKLVHGVQEFSKNLINLHCLVHTVLFYQIETMTELIGLSVGNRLRAGQILEE